MLLLALLLSFDAHASPQAKGTFIRMFDDEPTTLNAVTRTDMYANMVLGFTNDTLLARSDVNYEWVPLLAEKYEIAPDGSKFSFTIREGVKWSDGKPFTVEDVKYSFDVFFEGRFEAPFRRLYFEKIKEARIDGPRKITFIVKEPYYLNFDAVAEMFIIPKHFFGEGDPKDSKFNREIVGTGPYRLESWEKGQKLTLKKKPDYFADHLPYWKERYNFDKIVFRIVKDENLGLQLLTHGDLDFIDLRYRPDLFVQKTTGPEWEKTGTVIAVKGETSSPQMNTFGFIAWNQKNSLFKEKEARRAMTMLVNRPLMAKMFRFDLSTVARGPFGNSNPCSNPKVQAWPFDPKAALKLLQGLGWKLGEKGLEREQDGKKQLFEFTLVTANPDFEKYGTVIKEDMKAVGVTVNLKLVEWNTLTKLTDERNFDALNMGWSEGDLEPDPKRRYHSESIPSPGDNVVSYSNPKVDRMIDELRRSMSKKTRQRLYHRIHAELHEDEPYTYLFNPKYWLYAATRRIHRPQDSLRFSIARDTWSTK